MKNLLITGASGSIGKNLVMHLITNYPNSYNLVIICRNMDTFISSLNSLKNIKIIEHDLRNPIPLSTNILFDTVIHLAANSSYFSKKGVEKENSLQVNNLLHYINKKNLKPKFIFASSLGAIDRSPWDKLTKTLSNESQSFAQSHYGKGKYNDEITLMNSNLLDVSILRIPWVVGTEMGQQQHVRKLLTMAINNHIVSRFKWPGHVGIVDCDDLSLFVIELLPEINQSKRILSLGNISHKVAIGEIFKIGLETGMHSTFQIELPKTFIKLLYKFRGIIPYTLRCILFDVLINDTNFDYISPKLMCTFQSLSREIQKKSRKNVYHLLITGCSSGLGLAIAKAAYSAGFKVSGIDKIDPHNLEIFVKFTKLDLTSTEHLTNVTCAWDTNENEKNVLINNAGVCFTDPQINETNIIPIYNQILVNLLAPIYLHYVFSNRNLDRTVNILSSSVLVPLDKFSVYGSTKKALQFWQKTQDKQTIVIPSGINTKLYRTTSNHLRSHGLLEPDLVAKKILKGLLKNKSKINVGTIVHATRLLIHVVPEKLLIKFFRILSNRFK